MPLRRSWLLAGIVSISGLCLASIGSAPKQISGGRVSLAEREHHVWSSAVHDSEFATVARPAARNECGAVQPPQALATPDPLLDEAEVNAKVSVSLPEDRWLLFTRGPAWGPAVLFWGYLLVIVAVAIALGRLAWSPLRAVEWVLLGLGLTQLPPLAAFLVAAFFFAIVWRQRRAPQRAWLFDLVQIVLVVWTLIVLGCLYSVVETGLLLQPDMLVAGNGSNGMLLEWYADRVTAATPAVGVVSLPLWAWRATMLLWSLWLAASLVRWAGWTWRGWSDGGAWRPLWKARTRPQPPPVPPAETA